MAVLCSACSKVIATGSSIYSCRSCKPSYDVCFDCFNGLTKLKPAKGGASAGAAARPGSSSGTSRGAAPTGARDSKAKSAHAEKVRIVRPGGSGTCEVARCEHELILHSSLLRNMHFSFTRRSPLPAPRSRLKEPRAPPPQARLALQLPGAQRKTLAFASCWANRPSPPLLLKASRATRACPPLVARPLHPGRAVAAEAEATRIARQLREARRPTRQRAISSAWCEGRRVGDVA